MSSKASTPTPTTNNDTKPVRLNRDRLPTSKSSSDLSSANNNSNVVINDKKVIRIFTLMFVSIVSICFRHHLRVRLLALNLSLSRFLSFHFNSICSSSHFLFIPCSNVCVCVFCSTMLISQRLLSRFFSLMSFFLLDENEFFLQSLFIDVLSSH